MPKSSTGNKIEILSSLTNYISHISEMKASFLIRDVMPRLSKDGITVVSSNDDRFNKQVQSAVVIIRLIKPQSLMNKTLFIFPIFPRHVMGKTG